jgi:hypothetical protein
MLKVFWICVAALCLAAAGQKLSPRTELVIRAVDEAGAPVRLTRADVYFDVWGGGDVTHLPHDETSVRVHLDREGACRLEPGICADWPTFSARLILEARGLAPISSDLFDWMNAAGPLSESTSRAVTIRFPGAAPLRIRAGARRDITLTFRRRQPRSIRLVDRSGAPVTDAVVKVWNFFANSNHMGYPEGDVLVEKGRTDADGRLAVPDGDIEYSFLIAKRHWEAVGPNADTPLNQVVTRVSGATQTIVLRRHTRRPLLLKFQREGQPVIGLEVSGCIANCSGACCRRLATTDTAGNLTVRDFYPEEYDRVLVPTKEDQYKSIWEIDPRKLRQPNQRQTVNLPR